MKATERLNEWNDFRRWRKELRVSDAASDDTDGEYDAPKRRIRFMRAFSLWFVSSKTLYDVPEEYTDPQKIQTARITNGLADPNEEDNWWHA